MKHDIDSLTIISSATCNLNCSFCYLHKNKAYKEYNKLVHEAWQSGEYLQNIKKTFFLLERPLTSIKTIQVWGGETLLGIKDLTQNLENIYELFPNITMWQFSTNFTGMIDEFIEFLIKLNSITKHKTSILFQISIDGPPGPFSEEGHNGGWDRYRKNLKYFTEKVNNIKLEKIKMQINIHPTISNVLYLKEFTTYEGLKNYMQYMFDFSLEIYNACISESFEYQETLIFPNMATPYNDNSENGRNLAKVFQLWDEVYHNEFEHLIQSIPHSINFFNGMGNFLKDLAYNNGNPQCRECISGLTINYDGSISECSGSFIHNYPSYLEDFNNDEHRELYYEATMHNRMTNYNPHKLTQKEIDQYKWSVHEGGYRDTKTIYLHMIMSVAKELALAGQILEKYAYDDNLLFQHCWVFLNMLSCSRNNITDTHIPYLTPVGAIRRYFNGAMDFICDKGYYGKITTKLLLEDRGTLC